MNNEAGTFANSRRWLDPHLEAGAIDPHERLFPGCTAARRSNRYPPNSDSPLRRRADQAEPGAAKLHNHASPFWCAGHTLAGLFQPLLLAKSEAVPTSASRQPSELLLPDWWRCALRAKENPGSCVGQSSSAERSDGRDWQCPAIRNRSLPSCSVSSTQPFHLRSDGIKNGALPASTVPRCPHQTAFLNQKTFVMPFNQLNGTLSCCFCSGGGN